MPRGKKNDLNLKKKVISFKACTVPYRKHEAQKERDGDACPTCIG